MPLYTFKCTKCGLMFDQIECMEHRNNAQICPGCNGPASRDAEAELSGLGNVDETTKDHVRYSNSMGVNPSQIAEAERAYPGSKYTPDGRLIINSRQHKLMEMKRRGMEEIGGK